MTSISEPDGAPVEVPVEELPSAAADRASNAADRAEAAAGRAEAAAAIVAPLVREGERRADPYVRDGETRTCNHYAYRGGEWVLTHVETYRLDG